MRTIAEFKIHPTAALFPMLEGEDMQELTESIKTGGLHNAIIVDGDELIDGRNRLVACELANVEPRFIEWLEVGSNITKSSWILAQNVTRRHLTPDQRTAIWAKGNKNALREAGAQAKDKSKFKPGNNANPTGTTVRTNSCEPARDHKKENSQSTVGQVAAGAVVSYHKARQALGLQDDDLFNAVIDGKMKLKDAAKEQKARAPSPPRRQRKPAKEKPLKDAVISKLRKLLLNWGEEKKSEVKAIILEALQ